jgi:O-antigen ligase
LLFIAALPVVWPFVEDIFRLRAGMTGREYIWTTAWNLIAEHPFVGLGPTNFQPRFIFNAPLMHHGATMRIEELTAHNTYLHVGAEIGLFGLLLALALVGLFFYRSWWLRSHLKDTPHFPLLIALTAMFVAAFARSQFETDIAFQHGNLYKNLMIILMLAIQDNLSTRIKSSS